MHWAVLWLLVGLAVSQDVNEENPKVNITQGQLEGLWKKSFSGKRYATFFGIPYGEPPVGELRFKEPLKAGPWNGVRDASAPGSPCTQLIKLGAINRIYGSEDCLSINIHSSNLSSAANLPVILYIHGGAFTSLWGSYFRSRYIMDKEVVFITFNSRLNVLGFLSTEDENVPGNMGLKDQTLAMRWVKENIRNFGGNPDSITLNGASSGGSCVELHYFAPESRGLFHRGFSHSGSALGPYVIIPNPLERTKLIAAEVGCPTKDNKEMTNCLRTVKDKDLINATQQFRIFYENPNLGFGPVVEPVSSRNPFLSKYPQEYLIEGDYASVPWVVTVASEEGLITVAAYSGKERLALLKRDWKHLAPHMLFFNSTIPIVDKSKTLQLIKEHYLGDEDIGTKTFPQLIKLFSDRLFIEPAVRAAKLHRKVLNAPVYFYQFKYRGPSSLSDSFTDNKKNYGVSHADDALYIAETIHIYQGATNETIAMAKYLVDVLYSFANTGTPDAQYVKWEMVDGTETLKYLEIYSPINVTMKSSGNLGNSRFWSLIPFNENGQLHESSTTTTSIKFTPPPRKYLPVNSTSQPDCPVQEYRYNFYIWYFWIRFQSPCINMYKKKHLNYQ